MLFLFSKIIPLTLLFHTSREIRALIRESAHAESIAQRRKERTTMAQSVASGLYMNNLSIGNRMHAKTLARKMLK